MARAAAVPNDRCDVCRRGSVDRLATCRDCGRRTCLFCGVNASEDEAHLITCRHCQPSAVVAALRHLLDVTAQRPTSMAADDYLALRECLSDALLAAMPARVVA